MAKRIAAAELPQLLQALPKWRVEEGKWLVRRFRFAAFMDAIAFVNAAAAIAEAMNHHPLMAVDYRVVTLRLTTWSEGGLTPLDLTGAARYDEAYARWGREEE